MIKKKKTPGSRKLPFYFPLSFLEHGLDLHKVILPVYFLHLCVTEMGVC